MGGDGIFDNGEGRGVVICVGPQVDQPGEH
jgi:hypothetical protein